MGISTLKGRTRLIGPTFKVDVPINIDPKEYPGAIVYTSDDIHFFSDGTQWISFNDLVSEIRRPIITNPEDGKTTKDVRPKIEGTPRSSLFGDNNLIYRRFQIKKSSDFNWDNPVVDNEIQQDDYQIQIDLDFLTDYDVRIKDRDDISESSWSRVVRFQTPDNVVTPTNLSPQDGEVDVIQEPTLIATQFNTAVFSENHVASEFYLEAMDDGDNTTYNSGEISATRSHVVPAGLIDQQGTEYQWQCRYKGDQTGWSQWSSFTTFISENPRVIQPKNVIPNDGDTDTAVDNITLQSTVFDTSVEQDTHVSSEWEIYFDSDNTLAHPSGVTSIDLESYTVPSDALEGNVKYYWRVRHKGQILGWSKWSETTTFTPYEPFIRTPTGISPSDNELVGQEDQTLQSGDFQVAFGTDTHIASEWRVVNQTTLTTIYGPVETTSSLRQHVVPGENFQENTFYEWQVRYKGDQFGYSDWSSPKSFQVASRFISQPTNQNPSNGETSIDVENLTLSADAFEVQFGTDTHKDSQWQIRNNDTGQIIWDSQFDPTALESINVPSDKLEGGGQTYRWRVRYRGDTTEASEWSNETSFNGIKLRVEKPVNQYPLNGQEQVFRETTLEASAYSSNFDLDSHADTEFLIRNLDTGNIVDQPLLSGQAATTYDIPKGVLEINTEYEWQVRYRGTELDWSEWSDVTTFKTFENEDIFLFTNTQKNNINKVHKISALTGDLIDEYSGLVDTSVVVGTGDLQYSNIFIDGNKGYMITTDENSDFSLRKYFIEVFDINDFTLIDSMDISSLKLLDNSNVLNTDKQRIEAYYKDGSNFYIAFKKREEEEVTNGDNTFTTYIEMTKVDFSTKQITSYTYNTQGEGDIRNLTVKNGYLWFGTFGGNPRMLDKTDLSVIREGADIRHVIEYEPTTDFYYHYTPADSDNKTGDILTKATISDPLNTTESFTDGGTFSRPPTNFELSPNGEVMYQVLPAISSDDSSGMRKYNTLDASEILSNQIKNVNPRRIFLKNNNIIATDDTNDAIIYIDLNDLTVVNTIPLDIIPGGIDYDDFAVI